MSALTHTSGGLIKASDIHAEMIKNNGWLRNTKAQQAAFYVIKIT